MKHNGSCLCGEVQYVVENDFKVVMNCHCKYCRKAHAAPYITAALLPFKDVNIHSGTSAIEKYEIGNGRKRCFCSKCGSRLFNEISVPGFITLMVGSLDHPELVKPTAHVNLESKLENIEINDDLPKFDEFPSQDEIGKMLYS